MRGGVAPKFGSEKVSCYTGVSQVQLRVSRYTVQLSPALGPQKSGKCLKKDFFRLSLSFLSFFFFARKNHQRTRIVYPHRTLKSLDKKGKRSKKKDAWQWRKKNNSKKIRKGRTEQRLFLDFLLPWGCLRLEIFFF